MQKRVCNVCNVPNELPFFAYATVGGWVVINKEHARQKPFQDLRTYYLQSGDLDAATAAATDSSTNNAHNIINFMFADEIPESN